MHNFNSKDLHAAKIRATVQISSIYYSAKITYVESKRERTKKLNCLSIQEKENTRLIYREKTILGFAEYHN